MEKGYIKLHRALLNNPIVKKPEYAWLWTTLLLKATHKEVSFIWNEEIVLLKPGQFITGRKQLSAETGISQSKVYRILKYLKNEQQIEQQTTNKYTTITILNWKKYQDNGQHVEQPVNNKRTTTEQPVNTYKNVKNDKNVKNKEIYIDIISYLNEKASKNFKPNTSATMKHIKARLLEGYKIDDFKKVIDIKVAKWKTDPKMSEYLRPETLFGNKFDGYLNEKIVTKEARSPYEQI